MEAGPPVVYANLLTLIDEVYTVTFVCNHSKRYGYDVKVCGTKLHSLPSSFIFRQSV